MKSMSMVFHGISRLCCVWRWAIGLRSSFRPLIHILEGEKVWHQAIRPMQLAAVLACWHRSVISWGVLATGLKTTRTGMAKQASKALAISCEVAATRSEEGRVGKEWRYRR